MKNQLMELQTCPQVFSPGLAGIVSPHTATETHGSFSDSPHSLACLTSSASAPSLPSQKTLEEPFCLPEAHKAPTGKMSSIHTAQLIYLSTAS